MKKFLCLLLALVLCSACALSAVAEESAFVLPEKADMSAKPRVIITTDLEVDDINGIIMTLLYANEFDIAGLVWTAGMYHFSGDGVHTLAEVNPNYRCEVGTIGGTIANAGELKSFRPVEPGLLKRLIDVNYRTDYPYLSQNDPNYPTPDALLALVKEGNVAFEGDYREDTEGSDWIKQCILDDDPRPLYIEIWGGSNTLVRALESIYLEYHETEQWADIQKKVTDKVRLAGAAEDYCFENSQMYEKYPGLQNTERSMLFSYASFPLFPPAEELQPYYEGEYLAENIKFNHGDLLHALHLMGDGDVIYGEPYVYQYGLMTYMDWGELYDAGYSVLDWHSMGINRVDVERYHWLACQYYGGYYIDFGLDQTVDTPDTHYSAVFLDELAARADWASKPAAECNHAPVVTAENTAITAKPGETVELAAESATDPDGDALDIRWWLHEGGCKYGDAAPVSVSYFGESDADPDAEPVVYPAVTGEGLNAQITIPEDAQSGDYFIVNMEVKDDAEKPMTRFAQFVVTVE